MNTPESSYIDAISKYCDDYLDPVLKEIEGTSVTEAITDEDKGRILNQVAKLRSDILTFKNNLENVKTELSSGGNAIRSMYE